MTKYASKSRSLQSKARRLSIDFSMSEFVQELRIPKQCVLVSQTTQVLFLAACALHLLLSVSF